MIISPLISLMEDQVAKLNGLIVSDGPNGHISSNDNKKDIAVFLGSAQTNKTVEEKALNGEYKFVYCTPEKLFSGDGWFLRQMADLHTRNGGSGICLIAVDESHCVSEWGHDFRPHYRQVGSLLRGNHVLKNVPIVALTATAVPRVQRDIISSLQLRDPKIVKQSFDRDNLLIVVKRRPEYSSALKSFVTDMKLIDTKKSFRHESTIIYCPTKRNVEEITNWLSQQFEGTRIRVQSYHGGQSMGHRSDAHINFLTGKTVVIVATIAFGMGIDKTDTRRIIHYGPPKTVEEYYQQIGRAGRDGLEASCIMYCNLNDFEKYKDDFYLGGLTSKVRSYQESSIDSLRKFAMSDETCRRAELLKYFNEMPPFGARCGTCDTCVARKQHGDDMERDFAMQGGRLILYVLSVLDDKQGISKLEFVLKGLAIDPYRYRNCIHDGPVEIAHRVMEMKSQMSGYKKKVPVSYFTKDLLPALVNRGYVEVRKQSATFDFGNRTNTWSGYAITTKGWNSLESGPINLPVPSSIREYEKQQKEKMQKTLAVLKEAGADIDQIPKQEVEEGDGTVIKAFRTWFNYLERLQRNNSNDRIDELGDLRLRIDAWRMDMAEKFRIAPSDAMPDHILFSVAYAAATPKTEKIEREALLGLGLRSGGIDSLVFTINDWLGTTRAKSKAEQQDDDQLTGNSSPMILSSEPFKPAKRWEHFNYRPQKKTGLASWESSYYRFTAGEHAQTIAMSPINGRPIQVGTVVNHVLEGMLAGRPVDLKRLSTVSTPPTKSQWNELTRMEAETGIDATGNPKVSGKNGEAIRMVDFLEPVLGQEFTQKEYTDRTEEETAKYRKWCDRLSWYLFLRRAGYSPTYADKI